MSDSVDPMNSPQPLGEVSKPVTSMPSLAKVDTERQKRTPTAALAKIRSSHPGSSRIPDAVFRGDHPAERDFGICDCRAGGLGVGRQVASSRLHQFGHQVLLRARTGIRSTATLERCRSSYGTLVSSFLALMLAVPLSVGVAVYITEMCPHALRAIISFLVELLAAIPSVIYGLWGIFVLAPLLREYVEPFLARPSAGLDCSRARRTVWACWRPESFWPSWLCRSSPPSRARC